MRVEVRYTATVGDEYRRAVRRFYGQPGLASRAELKRWFETYGSSMDDDLSSTFEEDGDGD